MVLRQFLSTKFRVVLHVHADVLPQVAGSLEVELAPLVLQRTHVADSRLLGPARVGFLLLGMVLVVRLEGAHIDKVALAALLAHQVRPGLAVSPVDVRAQLPAVGVGLAAEVAHHLRVVVGHVLLQVGLAVGHELAG